MPPISHLLGEPETTIDVFLFFLGGGLLTTDIPCFFVENDGDDVELLRSNSKRRKFDQK